MGVTCAIDRWRPSLKAKAVWYCLAVAEAASAFLICENSCVRLSSRAVKPFLCCDASLARLLLSVLLEPSAAVALIAPLGGLSGVAHKR
jgi:hypothetical protein